jgi:ribosome-binding factor A
VLVPPVPTGRHFPPDFTVVSNRTLRIAALVQRELGAYLHTRYRTEAAAITVTGVQVAPDLKTGRIHFAILGTPEEVESRLAWLQARRAEWRRELARRVAIKHCPDWELRLDQTAERGARILTLLDQIEREEAARPAADEPEPSA